MTVLVRPKRLQTTRGRRQATASHHAGRPTPSPAATPAERREREQQRPSAPTLSNDRAMYKCVCGYVFEAPVSTSVGCPHCGGTQAW